ncbi:hypothetical protein FE633_12840 [Streptomyces montanus]|uniref:Uncharacterized protein n=1 Tax=Streptomyces montanus TaxID=2580423 RepID=A0A5R9FWB9_9ACTN|nr:hypothetical protein FE633_12840 [Streptomyces montanus]
MTPRAAPRPVGTVTRGTNNPNRPRRMAPWRDEVARGDGGQPGLVALRETVIAEARETERAWC